MKTRTVWLGLVLVLASAAALAGGWPLGPSPWLLPAGQSGVRDSHAAHLSKVPCAGCHGAAATSGWASQRLVPKMADCVPCHAEASGATALSPVTPACAKCHGPLASDQRPVPGSYPRPNLRFSHKAHAASQDCAACHPKAAGKPAAAGRDLPLMQQCYRCHASKGAALSACRTCHLADKDGVLVTNYQGHKLLPPGWLVGPSHEPGFAGNHATLAGANSELCAACHRETFCTDCHAGRLRPRNLHPGDWQVTHAVASRLDSRRCQGCHREQSFCLTCHRRAGVAPDSPAGAVPRGGAGRYHKGQSTKEICRRAKTDVTACVSCHSESSCISCHGVVNPHPSNWKRRCGKLGLLGQRACGKCHAGDAKQRCD